MISFPAALPTECPFCNGHYRVNYSRLSALRAVPRIRVGFRSWRFCVVLKADNLVQNNTPADAEANLDSSNYVFIDLRKADDCKAGHIKGAIAADMDACKGGDFQNGVDTMKAALKDATGSESGADKKLLLICYSGKTYAQAGTNVLSVIGANMDDVFTLEGGMKAWTGATEA